MLPPPRCSRSPGTVTRPCSPPTLPETSAELRKVASKLKELSAKHASVYIVHWYLSQAQLKLGQRDAAEETLLRCLHLRPDQPGTMQLVNTREKNILIPSVVVGAELLQGRSDKELAFPVAQFLTLMRPEHYLRLTLQTNTERRIVLLAAIKLMDDVWLQSKIRNKYETLRRQLGGGKVADRVADAGLHQRFAHRAGDCDLDVLEREAAAGFADELVDILVVVFQVAELDGGADEDHVLGHRVVGRDFGRRQTLLQAADLRLVEALVLAGGVVVGVLLQVAQGPGLGRLHRDLTDLVGDLVPGVVGIRSEAGGRLGGPGGRSRAGAGDLTPARAATKQPTVLDGGSTTTSRPKRNWCSVRSAAWRRVK